MVNEKPSDLELQVLAVLWEKGKATAREVLSAMPDGKQRAYTTILSVMQVMEKKGLLTHTAKGTAHVFRPTQSKSKTLAPFLHRLVTTVFGGSPSAAMQALLKESKLSKEELKDIRELIDGMEESK
ncbi:MAG: BlaI/MecI/CopY family transcriptional regulator [Sedimentisphaerales bacterium]|nr:BlaI/MecI/CopY family transcriptional regulator [Sedimentisphaerales bacterium]